MSIVADFIAGVVIVATTNLTRGEAVLFGAGGAAVFGMTVWVLLFGWNFARAPYRQRDRARRRLIAIIAIDAVAIEPFPDGGPAFLKITNQGPAGVFRVRLLRDTGHEYYLGWEDGKRDRRLFTGETGEAYVAMFEKDDRYMGGYVMVFYEADEDRPKTKMSWRVDEDVSTLRATDLRLAARERERWGAEIVLERGLFEPVE